MPTAKVRNLKNNEVGDVELLDAIFGVELNESLIHAAVRNYLANRRQGTSATKTRGNVSGSGRKLWKQKGTGRARIASIRCLCGKAAVMFTVHSHAIGHIKCRKKCGAERCARLYLKDFVKLI